MRNPCLSRQPFADVEPTPARNQKIRQIRRQLEPGLCLLAVLLVCAPLWSQQTTQASSTPTATTAAAASLPPLGGAQPANGVAPPAEAAPASTVHTGKHPKLKRAEDDVSLIGQRNVGGGVNFYSLQRERALGHQLAEEVESQSRMVSDPVVTEYVNRVGQAIVRHSDAKVPFTIKVVDDDEINAFALPGGFFYVDSGLILAADSE